MKLLNCPATVSCRYVLQKTIVLPNRTRRCKAKATSQETCQKQQHKCPRGLGWCTMQVKHEIKYCGRCSAQFTCKVDDVLACQCDTVSISQRTKDFLLETNYDCLCANCMLQLDKLALQHPFRTAPIPQLLIEGLHFYKENSLFVFTELYHYLKGTCCGNGCRHCAYGNSKHTSILKSHEPR